jgi:hypothetical protein
VNSVSARYVLRVAGMPMVEGFSYGENGWKQMLDDRAERL